MKTIHIFGNSPELCDLDPREFDNEICLGVNASYLWKPDMDYFVTGHTMWAYLYHHYSKVKRFFFFHGDPKDLEMPNMVNCNHNSVTMTDAKQLDKVGVLIGANMIGFSASHLAYKLGAQHIVYHGFDNTQPKHFYDYPPYSKQTLEHCRYILYKYPENELLQTVTEDFLHNSAWKSHALSKYDEYVNEYEVIFNFFKERGITVEVPLMKGQVYEAASGVW
jgi:hypothetical protein